MGSLAGILIVIGIIIAIIGYFMMGGTSGEASGDGAFVAIVGFICIFVGVILLVSHWLWDIAQKIF